MQRGADCRCGEDDHRERQFQKGDGDEGEDGDEDHVPALQRPLRHLDQRFENDGQYSRLQAEQQTLDQADFTEQQVEAGEQRQHKRAGQHEQQSGHQSAPDAMQQPAGIGGKLHRLGSGQEHAVVERVQEARFVQPFLLVDQDAVHQGDLPGRPAE
jgi:hypothetical protein